MLSNSRSFLLALLIPAAISFHGCAAVSGASVSGEAQSQWVYLDPNARLNYRTLDQGDRIMDFSSAGYGGGGAALPSLPVKVTVGPSGGDDSTAIQNAINAVSAMQPAAGFRGAVLLSPGTYHCSETLAVKTGGVVLRGSGSGPGGTLLRMTGNPHVCISITGSVTTAEEGRAASITDPYVPSGSTSFHISDASGLKVGDTILIRRPVTGAWIHFMGMDTLVRNGKKERWLSGAITTERTIQEMAGNQLTLDIPLSDSFDSRYLNPPGASLIKANVTGRIARTGVESLRILSPPQSIGIDQPQHQAIRINGVTDSWVKDIAIEDTINSVQVGGSARRVTVENVRITHTVSTQGAAKPADFAADGSQVLFHRCSSTGDNLFYFVTGARSTGPIVLLNCTFHGNGHIQPHQRWATGLLVDNCQVPESGIDFMNRGEMGSGHGWTIGWAVAWNCIARSYTIQQPPGSANWVIGCKGARLKASMPFGRGPELPEGFFDSHGTPVAPSSLYLAQLRERLGPAALRNLGQ